MVLLVLPWAKLIELAVSLFMLLLVGIGPIQHGHGPPPKNVHVAPIGVHSHVHSFSNLTLVVKLSTLTVFHLPGNLVGLQNPSWLFSSWQTPAEQRSSHQCSAAIVGLWLSRVASHPIYLGQLISSPCFSTISLRTKAMSNSTHSWANRRAFASQRRRNKRTLQKRKAPVQSLRSTLLVTWINQQFNREEIALYSTQLKEPHINLIPAQS